MKKTVIYLLLILGFCMQLSAQNAVKVTGTVTDETSQPVIGASVLESGTTNGTITDIDGKFTLSVKPGTTLEISFIGYQTETVRFTGQSVLNVILKEDAAMLDELVVIAYGGTQRRTKVTNSIAKVQEDVLSRGVYSNVGSALSGAVSGLRVTSSSGNPGTAPTITLRGGTDWGGTGTPLVVVDGQLRDGLNEINPEDIASMEVLKDAGATAVYGARASNGVILITTKTGHEGKAEIKLKARAGLNYANMGYEFLGAEDYLTYMRQAYNDPLADWIWKSRNQKATLSASQPFGTGNVLGEAMRWNVMSYSSEYDYLLEKGWKKMKDPVSDGYLLYKETNPQDYNIQSPAVTQDYNLNMSGGNEKGHYYAALGFNRQEGLPINTYYQRFNFTFNGDYKITKWLKSTSKFSYYRADWNGLPPTQTDEANYFGRIMSTPPTVRMVDEDGNPCLGPSAGDGNQSYQADKFYRDYQSDKFTMIQGFDATILPGLVFRVNGQWFISSNYYETFNHDYETAIGTYNRTRSSTASYARNFTQTYNATLNYNAAFADAHHLDAMLGAEYYDRYDRGFSATGQGAPTDDFMDLGLTATDAGKRSIDSNHSQYRIMSYFGRVNYDFKDRYLLSATFRYDGYSSLLGNNRWGFFPGVSAGWVFSRENFMKAAENWLSFGKLRASFGQNGNATGIGAYTLQGSYGTTQYDGSIGFLIGSLPNPGLKWERTSTAEAGFDLGFIQNRLNVNFTFYNRLTSDKYADYTLPTTTGFSSIKNNNGQFRNRGVELEIGAKLIRKKNLTWDLNFNIAYNKNMVVSLPSNGLDNNRQGGQEVYTGNGNETTYVGGYQEGQEPGMMVGYVFERLYQSDSEVPDGYMDLNGNGSGKTIVSYAKWNTLSDTEKIGKYIPIGAGDVKWKDINGDGIIDFKDQAVIGNTIPHWFGGFNTTLKWKGLTFYARFDYALGFWNYDRSTPWFNGCGQGTYNATTAVLDSWTPTNTDGRWPKYVFFDYGVCNNYFRPSTLFAYRGDYLAVREIQLSYSLPRKWMDKIRFQDITFSVSGQNLGYLTAYPGNTPEKYSGTSFASGDGYGLPRTILFGIDITF